MPRNYVKKGYTECQLEIARWIRIGHTMMREDPQLRCYACTAGGASGGDSANYQFVKFLVYNGHDMGNGQVQLYGNPNAVLGPGDTRINQTRNSRYCGLVIHVEGQVLRKRSRQFLAASGR